MDRLPFEIKDYIYKLVDELYFKDHKAAMKQVISEFIDVREERIISFWCEVARSNAICVQTDDYSLIVEGLERFIQTYNISGEYIVLLDDFTTVIF